MCICTGASMIVCVCDCFKHTSFLEFEQGLSTLHSSTIWVQKLLNHASRRGGHLHRGLYPTPSQHPFITTVSSRSQAESIPTLTNGGNLFQLHTDKTADKTADKTFHYIADKTLSTKRLDEILLSSFQHLKTSCS